jgi:hypothetical protein
MAWKSEFAQSEGVPTSRILLPRCMVVELMIKTYFRAGLDPSTTIK